MDFKQYNLESQKYKVPKEFIEQVADVCSTYITIQQVDTYYKCLDSDKRRTKIRYETNLLTGETNIYGISYKRENENRERESKYDFFRFENSVDYDAFRAVFGASLEKINVVSKQRTVYFYENARIHVDNVENLGWYVEIEIVITNTVEKDSSAELLKKLIEILRLNQYPTENLGYNELVK